MKKFLIWIWQRIVSLFTWFTEGYGWMLCAGLFMFVTGLEHEIRNEVLRNRIAELEKQKRPD